MRRKSARLSMQKNSSSSPSPKKEIIILNRKRKAEEDPEDMSVSKRRHQFQIENQWVPIAGDTFRSTIIPSRQEDRLKCCITTPEDFPVTLTNFRFMNYFTTPAHLRPSPLPEFDWADSKDVWQVMLKKDELYVRDANMMDRHSQLQPRMRAILLDWLVEVCEVYRLHRDTFYLATDFVDRYLSTEKNIPKTNLQLLGISALFIAAKTEEIYPPKLSDFAYVTDGACIEEDILKMELIMLKSLKWDLCPMTSVAWINLYLQLINQDLIEDKENNFVQPQYSSHAYIQIARLLDLCILDISSLNYTYSVLATAALYHMSSEQTALSVSGYQWMDIAACVEWMRPFALTVQELGSAELKFFPNICPDSTHHIQTHTVDLSVLEQAQTRRTEEPMMCSLRSSPDIQVNGLLTPPQSGKKCPDLE